jgi:hypothetical protein
MALYTFKIKIYDPIIVNALARLRKSRKQSAFTLEALKYFLASEQGVQVLNLMAKDAQSVCPKPHKTWEQPRQLPSISAETVERQNFPAGELPEDYCTGVLGMILK